MPDNQVFPDMSPPATPFSPPPPPKLETTHRDFLDVDTTRSNVFHNVLTGVQKTYPINNDLYELHVDNPRYDAKPYTLADQKDAILQQRTLDWKLKGDWVLRDKKTGMEVSRRPTVIARVPYLTNRGTFIYKGNEYTVANQQRLRPGVYARQKENGELESHVNLLPGTGSSFRLHMEPETGIFKFQAGQSHVPIFPLLKALGASDSDISAHWGPALYEKNALKNDPGVLKKVFDRMAGGDRKVREAFASDHGAGLRHVFAKMKLDPEVSERNLGKPHGVVDKDVLLRATQKLMNIHKGVEDQDDRDSQANQTIHGIEDLFKERITKDSGRVGKTLLWKSTYKRNLDHVKSGALTPQLHSVLLTSGLGQPISEINPIEIADQMLRVTRLGEGGIPGADAVPAEARNVQPSQLGFIDPVLGPESEKIGIDSRLATGTRKGDDGLLYQQLVNPKTGQRQYVSARQAVHSSLAFPGELDDPNRRKVRAMVGGRIRFVDRDKVDYAVEHPEHMFSLGANLVPGVSGIKGGRLLMAGKMIRQALPLKDAQSPYVQSAHPDGGSFESRVSKHVGAVRAEKDGVVREVTPDGISVQHDDGTIGHHETYDHFPFNYKTFLHNTATVKPNTRVSAGDLLAKSNYTDGKGNLALGQNLKVGYMPYQTHHGNNYEDAIVISESAAKKLTSEHMKQVRFDHTTEGMTVGHKEFLATFPGAYNRAQLNTIGSNGIVKPGTLVQPGDPLVLATRLKKPQQGSIAAALHRSNKSYLTDASETWHGRHEGVITDVHQGPDGIKVTVKHHMPMQIGDKMSGRYGDKGVVGAIVPDDQMPKDENGDDLHVLLNPLGIISRTNPSQLIEAALGKIAAKTGNPYQIRGFDNTRNLTQYALDELRKNGMSDTERVFDPGTNRHLPAVLTGNRFFYKLYHTADCYDKETEVLTGRGWVKWPDVRSDDVMATVEDNKLLYEKPLELVVKPYDGFLLGFEGRYVDYLVTPNHRMYGRYVGKGPFKFKTAEQVHGHNFWIRQFGFEPDTGDQKTDIRIGDITLPWGDYSELCGWFAGEGCTHVLGNHGTTTIYQSQQANPDNVKRIEDLFTRNGIKWRHHVAHGVIWGVAVLHLELAKHFRQFGTRCQDKHIPREVINGPVTGRLRCIEAIMLAEGNVQDTPTGESRRFAVTSKQFADDFQELLVRSGAGGVVRQAAPRKGDTIRLPVWKLGVALSRQNALVDAHRGEPKFRRVEYHDNVYCAVMRTGLLYVRRNGKPMLCGNTKETGRGDEGAYTADELPAKGGAEGAKRLGLLDINALISHGATEALRDAKLIRGQRNDAFWNAFRMGMSVPMPKERLVYSKYLAHLKGAGVNVERHGNLMNLKALTDADVDSMSSGKLEHADAVSADDNAPIPGGLFDVGLTGGHHGNRWSHIELSEKLPNPIMEEPIRRILGMTGPKFEALLKEPDGAKQIEHKLNGINLDHEIERQRQIISSGKKSKRDNAIKVLGYLTGAKKTGLHPRDFLSSKVPVLPPAFRPVTKFNGMQLTSDANLLYKDLYEADKNHRDLTEMGLHNGDSRLATYQAFKAVTGLGDPISLKNQEKGVAGLLEHVFGKSSPKFGMFQRKVLSNTIDVVGRAAITPNPSLDMDHVGLPESKAWDIYRPFIMRRLARQYNATGSKVPMTEIAKWITSKDPRAKKALDDEIEARPVLINRAPVWHRYGFMSAWPVLTKGETLHISPIVTPGFGADFDGDAMNYSVPVSDGAVHDAIHRMMPSKNLLSTKDFDVHMLPRQEYLHGLHEATRGPKDKPVRIFHSVKDVIAAYRRGDIDANDPVQVHEGHK